MPTIEIDAEVFEFLRSRIQNFNESPNDVLRRELRVSVPASTPGRRIVQTEVPTPRPQLGDPSLPLGAPEALRQIIEVVTLVRKQRMERVAATLRVAEKYRIARETVGDKYGRQLGLSTSQFDDLLAESSLIGLRNLLTTKFSAYRDDISSVLAELAR